MSQFRQKVILIFTVMFTSIVFAAEDSTYTFNWLDPDKEVYVLQNRKFRKVKTAYIHAGFGKTTSGAFADATAIQGRFGYFFTENWGVEVVYSSNSSSTNDTYGSVAAQQSVPFVRLVDQYYGALLMWSPFYAKINTFDKIFYFDWIFGLGGAQLTESNNRDGLNASSGGLDLPFTSETHSGLMWCTAMRFYVTENWSARLDVTAVHYQAKKALANSTEESWYQNYDLTAGVTYAF